MCLSIVRVTMLFNNILCFLCLCMATSGLVTLSIKMHMVHVVRILLLVETISLENIPVKLVKAHFR